MAIGGSSGGGSGAIRAGRAFVELFADDARLQRVLRSWEGKLKSFAGVAAKLGGGLLAGGTALAAPLAAAVGTLQDLAKQGSIAKAFGLTTEAFTGIAGVAKSAGEDTREFIESLVTLGKVASEGAAGKGEVAAEFFKELNLDAAEFAALKPDEMFFKFFEAVKKVEDPLRRVRLLMVAFGEDGGKYLLPLLDKSDSQLRDMAASFAISSRDVEAATKANASYNDMLAVMGRTWQAFAAAVAPALGEVFSQATRILAPVAGLIAQNARLAAGIVALSGGLVIGGAAMLGLSTVMTAAGTIAGAAASAIALLGTPLGATAAAVAALGAHWLTTSENGRRAVDALGESLGKLRSLAGTTIGGILDGLQVGDLEGAFAVATQGITALWKEMIVAMRGMWLEFQSTFVGETIQTVQDVAKMVHSLSGKGGSAAPTAAASPEKPGNPWTSSGSLQLLSTLTGFKSAWRLTGVGMLMDYNEAKRDERTRLAQEELDRARQIAEMEKWLLDSLAAELARWRSIREEEAAMARQTAENRRKAAEEYNRAFGGDPAERFRRHALDSKGWKRDREQEEMAKRLGITLPKSAIQDEVEKIRKEYIDRSLSESLNRINEQIGVLNKMAATGAGGFGGPLRAQFGISDKLEEKQLEALENIDKGVEQLPQAMAEQFERRWRLQ
ncbi:MAG: hypothetical protein U0791_24305 [Gemmataceae bacterium]